MSLAFCAEGTWVLAGHSSDVPFIPLLSVWLFSPVLYSPASLKPGALAGEDFCCLQESGRWQCPGLQDGVGTGRVKL